jgi:hypothetical protein
MAEGRKTVAALKLHNSVKKRTTWVSLGLWYGGCCGQAGGLGVRLAGPVHGYSDVGGLIWRAGGASGLAGVGVAARQGLAWGGQAASGASGRLERRARVAAAPGGLAARRAVQGREARGWREKGGERGGGGWEGDQGRARLGT